MIATFRVLQKSMALKPHLSLRGEVTEWWLLEMSTMSSHFRCVTGKHFLRYLQANFAFPKQSLTRMTHETRVDLDMIMKTRRQIPVVLNPDL